MPNITGSFVAYTWSGGNVIKAFSSEIINRNATIEGTSTERTYTRFIFKASKSNPIYGRFDTVMVKNVSVRYWKRTA